MATFNKINAFVENLAEGVHNLGSGALKVMLTNSAPSAANTVKTDITEISAGNGYTAGGATVTTSSSSQTSGTYRLVCADVVFTATGAVGPFRYAILYNATTGVPFAAFDYGGAISLASADTFTFTFPGSAFTVA